MHYDVITFDTQTVETNSFHFDGGLLAQLKQFKEGPVRVVLSEVVAREIYQHLVEKTRAAKDSAASAHKKAIDYGLAPQDRPFIYANVDIRALARSRLDAFLPEIGTHFIRVDDLRMKDLVEAYFQHMPPFSAAGKNKAEFPDALALMSLERWATQKKLKVLAVSNDKGWKAYADQQDWIDLREDLADALSLLQQHEHEARSVFQALLDSIDNGSNVALTQKVDAMLANALANYDVYGEAEAFYETDAERVELQLLDFRFVNGETDYEFSLVQSGKDVIAAEVEIEASVRAETTFYLSVYDSIDKDSTPAGSVTAHVNEELTFRALVTFERENAESQFDLFGLELIKGPRTISFGFIEPDYEPEPEESYDTTGVPSAYVNPFDDDIPI